MAGFIFYLNDEANLETIYKYGIFSVYIDINIEKNTLNNPQLDALGDHFLIKEADNVYFFKKRKIYGIGRVESIEGNCFFLNFKDSFKNINLPSGITDNDYVFDFHDRTKINFLRWIILFKPLYKFFKKGVDMDEALLYKPTSFRRLRTGQDRSFIKIDDEENNSLKNFIIKKNKEEFINIFRNCLNNDAYFDFDTSFFNEIKNKLTNNNSFWFDYNSFFKNSLVANNNKVFEKNIELDLVWKLNNIERFEDLNTIFDKMDFITKQLPESPFKPIVWMNKIDIFGYKYLEQYKGDLIDKYVVIEVKKGKGNPKSINQLLRYIDWIKDKYCNGDYSMIEAYLVACDFTRNIGNHIREFGYRNYLNEFHNPDPKVWKNVNLIKYDLDIIEYQLKYSRFEYDD